MRIKSKKINAPLKEYDDVIIGCEAWEILSCVTDYMDELINTSVNMMHGEYLIDTSKYKFSKKDYKELLMQAIEKQLKLTGEG